MPYIPVTTSSDSVAVAVAVDRLSGMVAGKLYLFVSSTNCWIKQGTTKLVTCATDANMTDGDTLTIAVADGLSVTYEYDKAADGVAAGNASWAAGAVTAADVAATLATAIGIAQPALVVTDNADGTLTITAKDKHATFTEEVAHASFTVADEDPPASAADGSMFVPALAQILLDGNNGPLLGVIRSTADGFASLTRVGKVI